MSEVIQDAEIVEEPKKYWEMTKQERKIYDKICDDIVGGKMKKITPKGRAYKRKFYNRTCTCGSGRKFKNCCFYKQITEIERRLASGEIN